MTFTNRQMSFHFLQKKTLTLNFLCSRNFKNVTEFFDELCLSDTDFCLQMKSSELI